jgi:hypothetical protein
VDVRSFSLSVRIDELRRILPPPLDVDSLRLRSTIPSLLLLVLPSWEEKEKLSVVSIFSLLIAGAEVFSFNGDNIGDLLLFFGATTGGGGGGGRDNIPLLR